MQQRVFDALAPHGKRTRLFDLYAAFPMFDRVTIYKALQRLCAARLARRVRGVEHPTYELEIGAARPEDGRGRRRVRGATCRT